MERPKDWASIKIIEDVVSLQIKRLSFFQSLIKKHQYSIIVSGRDDRFEGLMDRIALEGIEKVVLGKTDFHVNRLNILKWEKNGTVYGARITQYPNNGYAVAWIFPVGEKYDERGNDLSKRREKLDVHERSGS